MLLLLWTGSAAGALRSGEARLHRYQYSQMAMGVQVTITLYAPDQATAERACAAAFERIAEIEQIASDYRPDSELMRLCAQAGGAPVRVSEELFTLLQRAQALAQRTGGAFDITVGPYVQLWRRARRTGQFPTGEELREARGRVGYDKIVLDERERTVRLLVPGMRLDLGGIAKGYALDCALRVLQQHGVHHALLEAGGDIVAGLAPPGTAGWRIRVENAAPERQWVYLARGAISSSGDTEQYVEHEGKRYSHIVDPRTGWGLTTRVAATVIARDGITSDSLATALCVLGKQEGMRLIRAMPGVRAYIREVKE
ncbi:MAG: FAD:protein FMN transferase [Armatimonadota bacterium]|nr:FAD:protein FMN transferase [Armatimonadota bacterium]